LPTFTKERSRSDDLQWRIALQIEAAPDEAVVGEIQPYEDELHRGRLGWCGTDHLPVTPFNRPLPDIVFSFASSNEV